MKELSTLTKAASAVAAIGTLIGAVLIVDTRYAHAADFNKYQQNQAQELRLQLNSLRGQLLEDKLFELETKPNKSQQDLALIERFKRQLEETKIINKK